MNYSEAEDLAAGVEEKAQTTLTNLLELDRIIRGAPFAKTRETRIEGIKQIRLDIERQEKTCLNSKTQRDQLWVALKHLGFGLVFTLTAFPPDLPWEDRASAVLRRKRFGYLTVPYTFFLEVLKTLEREIEKGEFDSNLDDDARKLANDRLTQATLERVKSWEDAQVKKRIDEIGKGFLFGGLDTS